MKMLEDRIRKDGIVREGNVLKVDSFINHQMDIPLFREMAKEWKRLFDGKPINKVLTIEASGIGIAAVVASEFNVPVVFAKKSMSINLDYDNYETKIQSFTHKKIYNVIVSKTVSYTHLDVYKRQVQLTVISGNVSQELDDNKQQEVQNEDQ